MSDLVKRLRASCVGRTAAISWPHRTLHEAADRIEELEAKLAEVSEKATAVVDRWDSLDWKQPHTADFINDLRATLTK